MFDRQWDIANGRSRFMNACADHSVPMVASDERHMENHPGIVAGEHANSWRFDPSGWWFLATPLKNMNVNWDDDSQYMGK